MTPELNLTADYFTLLGLPPTQAMELSQLDQHFRELQARVHPDKFADATSADQRLSMQWATRVNEAYQHLKSPIRRARYLLELNGLDVGIETNTAMPVEFLMAQMERREALDELKVSPRGTAQRTLDTMHKALRAEIRQEEQRLTTLIDEEKNLVEASALVRQLMFQEKLLNEIDDAIDELDELDAVNS